MRLSSRPPMLTPIFPITMTIEGRKHIYRAEKEGVVHRLESVTGYLGVIAKPALVNWAAREAVVSVEGELLKQLNGQDSAQITLDKSWIQSVIASARKKPDQIKDAAADLGTRVHSTVDQIVKGQKHDAIPDEIKAPVEAFLAWWKHSGIEIVLGDTKVASLVYQYAGSLDALGFRNGKYVLIDLKTSSGCWPEFALQVAAYSQALSETYGITCDQALILRLGKKPPYEFEVKTVADLALSFRAFLAAKTLKDALEKPQYEAF